MGISFSHAFVLSGLGAKEVKIDSYRYIVVRNEKQARKDAKVRDEVLERLGVILELIAAGKASVCNIQHSFDQAVRSLTEGRNCQAQCD